MKSNSPYAKRGRDVHPAPLLLLSNSSARPRLGPGHICLAFGEKTVSKGQPEVGAQEGQNGGGDQRGVGEGFEQVAAGQRGYDPAERPIADQRANQDAKNRPDPPETNTLRMMVLIPRTIRARL